MHDVGPAGVIRWVPGRDPPAAAIVRVGKKVRRGHDVTCGEVKRRAWLYQKRASHCPAGQAMTPANTYRRPGRKFRDCRKCLG